MRGFVASLGALVSGIILAATAQAGPLETLTYQRGDGYIQIEIWRSDLVHFEFGQGAPQASIWTTPSILSSRRDPSTTYFTSKNTGGDAIETADLKITIPKTEHCISVVEKKYHNKLLGRFCSKSHNKSGRRLIIESRGIQNLYGLGQQLDNPAQDRSRSDDWVGRRRESPSPFGNYMKSFLGGAVGDTQIPVLYALGSGRVGYGLYVDAVEKLVWDFQRRPWWVETSKSVIRGFLISGADLQDWRRGYMELTGKPPVPPRKMFGLWVSEYGYDNWQELDDKLASLRKQDFPVDGFVMDLQWFGGVKAGADDTPMGGLVWDRKHFPEPEKKVAELRDKENLGLILIEESYVGRDRLEHSELAKKGMLARDCKSCGPSYIDGNSWWGKGGMIDWSNPDVGFFWHKWKRQPLVDSGVMGHWTDLGEPEMFQPWSWYFGFPSQNLHDQASVHNYFSFLWHQGIFDSYERYHQDRRPFVMSRSAAAGSQRFGVGMWSGDIGSNMASLASHLRAQMHMSLSGMDYYGSDIGGFHRSGLDGDLDSLYTQWFANASLLDIPLRPHVENLCNCKETAPDRIGHGASNRENLILRYQLAPYYYSLAHHANEKGTPLFPPLVFHFQEDPLARGMAHQKMLGPWLMTGIVAAYGQGSRQLYLPAGEWMDFYSGNKYDSDGEWIQSDVLWKNSRFRLPLFLREGAIVPMASRATRHLSGHSGLATELKIFPSKNPTWFDLVEDDGVSTGYLRGEKKVTRITQTTNKHYGWKIYIAKAEGSYKGAPSQRSWTLRIHHPGPVESVEWQGKTLESRQVKESRRVGTWQKLDQELVIWTPPSMDSEVKILKVNLRQQGE